MSQTYNAQCVVEAERICWGMGFELANILGGKTREKVRFRELVAVQLRDMGFSFPEIGHALGLDHSTVMVMLRRVAKREAVI